MLCRLIQVKRELPGAPEAVFTVLVESPFKIRSEYDRGRALKYINAVFYGVDLMAKMNKSPLLVMHVLDSAKKRQDILLAG